MSGYGRMSGGIPPWRTYDLICKHCYAYHSEHAGDDRQLCLFRPTRYEMMTYDEYAANKIVPLPKRLR